MITGTYSLTQQAIALNMLPRMVVQHTSETQSGQIYMPQINTMLMVGVLLLVLLFGSSSALVERLWHRRFGRDDRDAYRCCSW